MSLLNNIKGHFLRSLSVVVLLVMAGSAQALVDAYEFEQPEQREQFFRMNDVLRCPLCQNQSIAESNAPIANDLRREVHRMIAEENADDEEIVQFMLDRFGDFVLYKPRMDSRTFVLWFGPLILLLLGGIALIRLLKKHNSKEVVRDLNDQDREELENILGGKNQ